jgi:monoamine oxidase
LALDRRDFVRLLVLQGAAWSLGCGRREGGGACQDNRARIIDLPGNPHSGRWMGDDMTLGHRFRDGDLQPSPDAGREAPRDVVVVGGGVSGLAAACMLAGSGRSVVLLEQAAVLGGNSQSASWGDLEYAIGAAYFTRPDEGSPLESLYRDLGILDRAVQTPHGMVLHDGRLRDGLWDGALAAAADAGGPGAGQAIERTRELAAGWRRLYEERYPAIPWSPGTAGWSRPEFERLDRMPFAEYLADLAVPADVRMFCEYYCWSSFGGAATEISSYAALNFLTAEFGEILALPGGNAAIAKALAGAAERKGVELITSAFTGAVYQDARGVEAAAFRGDRWRRFPARACVMAIPRYVAARVVRDFPEDRREIVAGMAWRAYIVANVLLARRPCPGDWFDAYRIEKLDPQAVGWTDLVLADYASSSRTGYGVLTAYRALPHDGGRFELLTDEDYRRHSDAVRRDLIPWLGALGLEERDIVDINLARWGHPLVLAKPGQLASGDLEHLSAPLGRIAFAHQDRYGVPAIESALEAAIAASGEVARILDGSRSQAVF